MPKPLRVLHLPVNIASVPSHTVRCLREIGVDARGLVYENAVVQSAYGLKTVNLGWKRYSFRWLVTKLYLSFLFFRWVYWADVIHWYFGAPVLPWNLDFACMRWVQKPAIVEWMGSDIRIPEVECAENPYYAAVFESGYEYQNMESRTKSIRLQQQFAQSGFASGAAVGMMQYVQDTSQPRYVLPQRLVLSDYHPAYPRVEAHIPLVVHSPTAPVAKGTPVVLAAIEQLKQKYNFEFQLLQGLERHRALQIMQRADIFLDQFVLGDRGMASLEAMALGKPVLCYIKPSLATRYPSDLPIVNTNQENLVSTLGSLLKDFPRCHALGRRGRTYVEKYHDGLEAAHQLEHIYRELVARSGVRH